MVLSTRGGGGVCTRFDLRRTWQNARVEAKSRTMRREGVREPARGDPDPFPDRIQLSLRRFPFLSKLAEAPFKIIKDPDQ